MDKTQAEKSERAAECVRLARAALRRGEAARAGDYVRTATELDPHNRRYRAMLDGWQAVTARAAKGARLLADADAAEKARNFSKARQILDAALALNPESAPLHNRFALFLASHFRTYKLAIEHLERAIDLDPRNVTYKSNLGGLVALADAHP